MSVPDQPSTIAREAEGSPMAAVTSTAPPIDVLQQMHEEDQQVHGRQSSEQTPGVLSQSRKRPTAPRSSTDSSLLSLHASGREFADRYSITPHERPPHASCASHLRRRSSGGSAPATLTRAHSSPAIHTRKTLEGAALSSPHAPALSVTSNWSALSSLQSSTNSPVRARSPFSTPSGSEDESSTNTTSSSAISSDGSGSGSVFEAILEDSELDISHHGPSSQVLPLHALVPRSSATRRRPGSPLHSVINAPQPSRVLSTPFSATFIDHNMPTSSPANGGLASGNSPSLGPLRYNESFPSLHSHGSATSMASSYSSLPSTPTSARSRSPSISSLGTIEDVPDLEVEAMELDRIERLKAAAEKTENGVGEEDSTRRRSSFDTPRGFGFGFARSRAEQRKRWSVCGAERRADLDLETIWED